MDARFLVVIVVVVFLDAVVIVVITSSKVNAAIVAHRVVAKRGVAMVTVGFVVTPIVTIAVGADALLVQATTIGIFVTVGGIAAVDVRGVAAEQEQYHAREIRNVDRLAFYLLH